MAFSMRSIFVPNLWVWSSPVFFMMTSRSSISEEGSLRELTNLSRISLRDNETSTASRRRGRMKTQTLSRGPRALIIMTREVHRYGLPRRRTTRPLCKPLRALLYFFDTKRPRMKGNMTQATPEVVSQRYINGSIHEYVGQPGEGATRQATRNLGGVPRDGVAGPLARHSERARGAFSVNVHVQFCRIM